MAFKSSSFRHAAIVYWLGRGPFKPKEGDRNPLAVPSRRRFDSARSPHASIYRVGTEGIEYRCSGWSPVGSHKADLPGSIPGTATAGNSPWWAERSHKPFVVGSIPAPAPISSCGDDRWAPDFWGHSDNG